MKKLTIATIMGLLLLLSVAEMASARRYYPYCPPVDPIYKAYKANDDYQKEFDAHYYSYTRHGSRYVDHANVGSNDSLSYGYADTTHTTDGWQRLGSQWGVDDGVVWSTDGGATWGHDTLYVGGTVMFRFDFQRTNDGVHDYDQIKAWLDWDVDRTWDNDTELVYAEQWYANYTKQDLDNDDLWTLQKYCYSENFIVPESALGTTWLRTRVHCTHTAFEDTNPYDALTQGEVEDWMLVVEATPTPEPSTVVLLGLGLMGVVGYTRKRTKK